VVGVRVLNNPPQKAAQVSDKLWLARWLEEKGFPFIRTEERSDDLPDGLLFPLVVKPRRGAGGVGCRLVESAAELRWEDGLIAQERVFGRPASVSIIGNGREARALAVNEQIIGAAWTGAQGFRYCGNITPLDQPHCDIAEMAEDIVAQLGLVGSNGVDFLMTSRGPVVVEVNCRFQGSLDTVEMATGMNLFQPHLEAYAGSLPERPECHYAAGRAIIYARRDLRIDSDLSDDCTRDVPGPGSRIGRDDPVLSIIAKGPDRDGVYAQLMAAAARLQERMGEKLPSWRAGSGYQDTAL
jgi:predicted ATP-grasp superfamily ATP-dependent carboligase